MTAAERDRWKQSFRLSQEFDRRIAEHESQINDIVLSMVGVLDSLDRLIGDTPPAQRTGPLATCTVIARQLQAAVVRAGTEIIGEVGDALDLGLHTIVEVRNCPGTPTDTVIEVKRHGYRRGDVVLRTADVIVCAQRTEQIT